MKKDRNAKGDEDCNGDGAQTPFEEEGEDSCQRGPAGLSRHGAGWADLVGSG